MKKTTLLKSIQFVAAAILFSGCAQTAPVEHSEAFAPDDQPRAINRLMDAQAARGAASDATLFTCHFTGANLNSLGTSKLDLMLADSSTGTMKVWMAVADDDLAQARRMSVGDYLKNHGVPLEQIQFGQGANPDTDHSALKGLSDLPKTDSDSGSTGSSGGSTNSSPTNSTPSATPGGTAGTP